MYNYEKERQHLFTDEGQRLFLKIRDHVMEMLRASGAVTMAKALEAEMGDSWHKMACVDRMVELKELLEIRNPYSDAGQHRIFVRA